MTSDRVGAGFGQAGLMAGLRVGQALGCSTYLGLGLAVPAPMFLSTQPPCATYALNIIYMVNLVV